MKIPFLVLVAISILISSCGPVTPYPASKLISSVTTLPTGTNIPTFALPNTLTETETPALTPIETNTPIAIETLDAYMQPVYHQPASNAIRFFLDVRDALQANDKARFAGLIRYPTKIAYTNGSLTIHSPNEFIAYYDNIVTDTLKNVVLAQDPGNLIIWEDDFMVGRGELWFDAVCLDSKCVQTKWYITAINTTRHRL